LEREISKLNEKLKEVQKLVDSSSGDEGYSVLAEWSKSAETYKSQIEEKEERWLELAAKE